MSPKPSPKSFRKTSSEKKAGVSFSPNLRNEEPLSKKDPLAPSRPPRSSRASLSTSVQHSSVASASAGSPFGLGESSVEEEYETPKGKGKARVRDSSFSPLATSTPRQNEATPKLREGPSEDISLAEASIIEAREVKKHGAVHLPYNALDLVFSGSVYQVSLKDFAKKNYQSQTKQQWMEQLTGAIYNQEGKIILRGIGHFFEANEEIEEDEKLKILRLLYREAHESKKVANFYLKDKNFNKKHPPYKDEADEIIKIVSNGEQSYVARFNEVHRKLKNTSNLAYIVEKYQEEFQEQDEIKAKIACDHIMQEAARLKTFHTYSHVVCEKIAAQVNSANTLAEITSVLSDEEVRKQSVKTDIAGILQEYINNRLQSLREIFPKAELDVVVEKQSIIITKDIYEKKISRLGVSKKGADGSTLKDADGKPIIKKFSELNSSEKAVMSANFANEYNKEIKLLSSYQDQINKNDIKDNGGFFDEMLQNVEQEIKDGNTIEKIKKTIHQYNYERFISAILLEVVGEYKVIEESVPSVFLKLLILNEIKLVNRQLNQEKGKEVKNILEDTVTHKRNLLGILDVKTNSEFRVELKKEMEESLAEYVKHLVTTASSQLDVISAGGETNIALRSPSLEPVRSHLGVDYSDQIEFEGGVASKVFAKGATIVLSRAQKDAIEAIERAIIKSRYNKGVDELVELAEKNMQDKLLAISKKIAQLRRLQDSGALVEAEELIRQINSGKIKADEESLAKIENAIAKAESYKNPTGSGNIAIRMATGEGKTHLDQIIKEKYQGEFNDIFSINLNSSDERIRQLKEILERDDDMSKIMVTLDEEFFFSSQFLENFCDIEGKNVGQLKEGEFIGVLREIEKFKRNLRKKDAILVVYGASTSLARIEDAEILRMQLKHIHKRQQLKEEEKERAVITEKLSYYEELRRVFDGRGKEDKSLAEFNEYPDILRKSSVWSKNKSQNSNSFEVELTKIYDKIKKNFDALRDIDALGKKHSERMLSFDSEFCKFRKAKAAAKGLEVNKIAIGEGSNILFLEALNEFVNEVKICGVFASLNIEGSAAQKQPNKFPKEEDSLLSQNREKNKFINNLEVAIDENKSRLEYRQELASSFNKRRAEHTKERLKKADFKKVDNKKDPFSICDIISAENFGNALAGGQKAQCVLDFDLVYDDDDKLKADLAKIKTVTKADVIIVPCLIDKGLESQRAGCRIYSNDILSGEIEFGNKGVGPSDKLFLNDELQKYSEETSILNIFAGKFGVKNIGPVDVIGGDRGTSCVGVTKVLTYCQDPIKLTYNELMQMNRNRTYLEDGVGEVEYKFVHSTQGELELVKEDLFVELDANTKKDDERRRIAYLKAKLNKEGEDLNFERYKKWYEKNIGKIGFEYKNWKQAQDAINKLIREGVEIPGAEDKTPFEKLRDLMILFDPKRFRAILAGMEGVLDGRVVEIEEVPAKPPMSVEVGRALYTLKRNLVQFLIAYNDYADKGEFVVGNSDKMLQKITKWCQEKEFICEGIGFSKITKINDISNPEFFEELQQIGFEDEAALAELSGHLKVAPSQIYNTHFIGIARDISAKYEDLRVERGEQSESSGAEEEAKSPVKSSSSSSIWSDVSDFHFSSDTAKNRLGSNTSKGSLRGIPEESSEGSPSPNKQVVVRRDEQEYNSHRHSKSPRQLSSRSSSASFSASVPNVPRIPSISSSSGDEGGVGRKLPTPSPANLAAGGRLRQSDLSSSQQTNK